MSRPLTASQELAHKLLVERHPNFVTPTDVGKTVGLQLGKQGRHSAFGTPLCRRLVAEGLAERNEDGHYRAIK